MPTVSHAADLRVDHATIAGTSLDRMLAEFKQTGLAGEYGGNHPNQATQMAVISFEDGSYLELISAQERADPRSLDAHPWAKFIRADAGPCAWAVHPVNLAEEIKRLRNSGVAADDVTPGGRDRPDGVHLEWQTSQVHGDRGAFFPFMINDVTPRERRVFPHGKPTAPSFAGVTKIIIAVDDLESAVTKYRRTFGLTAPKQSTDAAFGAKLASFEGTPVVLAAPLAADNWIAARVRAYGNAPCAFAVRRASSRPSGGIEWLPLKTIHGRIGIE